MVIHDSTIFETLFFLFFSFDSVLLDNLFLKKLLFGYMQVCLMCLVPLFLVPIVNILPLLVDFLLVLLISLTLFPPFIYLLIYLFFFQGKVYKLFGWNYRKPERAAPACPYKPATGNINDSVCFFNILIVRRIWGIA